MGRQCIRPAGNRRQGACGGATTTRGELHNYTWVENPPREIRLEMSTGWIYNNRGPANIELAHRGAADVEKVDFHRVDAAEIPGDRQWREVRFIAKKKSPPVACATARNDS